MFSPGSCWEAGAAAAAAEAGTPASKGCRCCPRRHLRMRVSRCLLSLMLGAAAVSSTAEEGSCNRQAVGRVSDHKET